MKSDTKESLQTMKSKVKGISPLRVLLTVCTIAVAVACVCALWGTFSKRKNNSITHKLYGVEIGEKGLRYKYGDHIYDPKTGKILLDSISWLYIGGEDTIGIVAKHKKRAYLNLNTAQVLTRWEYDKAWAFRSGRGVMVKEDTIYIFRPDGSIVNHHGLPYCGQYELLFHQGKLILETKDHLVGLLDTAANWILPPQYAYIDNNYQHHLYNTKTNDECIVYNYDLDTIVRGNYKSVDIDWSEGIITTEYNGVQHLYDYDGKMVYEVIYKRIRELTYNTRRKGKDGRDIYEETDCLVYEDYNRKCGLMDRHYRILTPPLFFDITAESKHIFFATFGDYDGNFGTLIDDHGKPIR